MSGGTITGSQVVATPAVGTPIIATQGLRKTFRTRRGRRVVAVEGLDLAVRAGGVHGFLGPNGSGKTTTIRMLLGLMRPDAGAMQLFGEQVPSRLGTVMPRIGAIVEQPRLFARMTGWENLALLAHAVRLPGHRIGEVLDLVGLTGREREMVRGYSLGMKQRLAIAAAMLKSPALLILDEPTNGLDPAGIREIRQLMRGLADRGVTILVSSHILSELEQVVDAVTIIARGRLLASGTLADVVGARSGSVRVGVDEPDRAAAVLAAAGLRPTRTEAGLTVAGATDPAQITRVLAGAGLYLRELTSAGGDLEDVFLEITAARPGASGDPTGGVA